MGTAHKTHFLSVKVLDTRCSGNANFHPSLHRKLDCTYKMEQTVRTIGDEVISTECIR